MDSLFQNNSGEKCEHPPREMLLLFVDGEVPAKEAGQLEAHLEACWPCRVKTQKIQAAIADIIEFDEQVLTPRLVPPKNWRNFERQLRHLARESGSPSLSSRLFGFLAQVQLRLKIAGFSSALSWRFVAVPAALCLVFVALIIWLAITPSFNISASEILSESERRTSIWENQPDKVLHWGYEYTFSNSPILPDGKYTSFHWQQNTGGKAFRLNRLYDANGVLVWASWIRTDGSEVNFSRFPEDEVTIFPATDVLLAYAAGLNEKSRQTLENYVRSSNHSREISPERDWEIKLKYVNPSSDRGSVEIIQTAEFGKVFRIQGVLFIGKGNPIRVETETDFAADNFRRLRYHKVTRYHDGKTAIDESLLKFYEETSVEDFNANDLSKEMQQAKRIVQVTPEEILKRLLQEEAGEKNDRQAK